MCKFLLTNFLQKRGKKAFIYTTNDINLVDTKEYTTMLCLGSVLQVSTK